MELNIHKLNKELFYHPHWPEDQKSCLQLLYQSSFTDEDIVLLARLYVKYSHLHCFTLSELTKYFQYMLQKTQIYNHKNLFKRTREIYRNDHHL